MSTFMRHRLSLLAFLFLYAFTFGSPLRAATASRPNFLFIIADDWGNNNASIFGTKWINTPGFDRIAREGILFKNAFTSNPKCSPCRATILTGRNSWQLEEASCHNGLFPAKFAVYPDLLENSGYFVGYTGKGWGPGDYKLGGFKRNPAGPTFSQFKVKPPYSGIGKIDYSRNFEAFLAARKPGQPFCFWFGGQEPHRAYEEGSGVRAGKNIKDVKLPAYYPNSNVIKSDFLDYALEVEWFDSHVVKALKTLEEAGELDNTLIIMTSDHGMPFPRVKGQIYEQGFHIPFALRWGAKVKPGRVVEDFINMRDVAPTFMELAGLKPHPQMTGKSFVDILMTQKSGVIDPTRDVMLVGKERHDTGRPHDWGYPVRAIRTTEYLYVHNYEPDRWPAGNPETGYRNCDDGPTKTFLLRQFDNYYKLSFGHRPEEELYRINSDGDCVQNLASDPAYAEIKAKLRQQMDGMLKKEKDPRALGNGAIFDTYKYLGGSKHSYDEWLKNQ